MISEISELTLEYIHTIHIIECQNKMKDLGVMLPNVLFISKRTTVDTKEFPEDISIIDISSETLSGDLVMTVVTFKGDTKDYLEKIQVFIDDYVSKYDPLSVGLSLQGFYFEAPSKDMEKVKDIRDQPETISIVHSSYYTKSDSEGYLKHIPYIKEEDLEDTHIIFCDTPWVRPSFSRGSFFKDPFRR